MRILSKFVFVAIFLTTVVISQDMSEILKPDLGKKIGVCEACGMEVFEKMLTRVEIKVKDTSYHACGLGCAQTIMEKRELNETMPAVKLFVLDFETLGQVEAEKAQYVVGSVVLASRAMIPYLVFKKKRSAEKFVKLYNGRILDYAAMSELVKKVKKR